MTQDKIKKIHRWYGCAMSVIITTLGILLILSCLDIYTSGPRPYSADAIGLQFQRILIPVIIGFIGIIGGIALNLLFPSEHKHKKACSHPEDIMLRLRKKADVPPVQKEIKQRLFYRIATAFCFTGLMVYPVIYFLTPGHFSVSSLNADIVRSILVALIPTSIGLLMCWICRDLVNKSFQRESSIYKKAIAEGHRTEDFEVVAQTDAHPTALTAIRILLVLAGISLLIAGIINGGSEDVLKKAIAICTECIGLG